MLADIEEDIANQKKDVTQQVDISQPVITALVLKKKRKKTHNSNSRNI